MPFRRISTLDCYAVAFGLFLFASPWLFAYVSEKVRIEIWVSGAAVAAIAIAAIVAFSDWEEWLNLLLGIWLVISPWVIGFVHTKAMHVSILIGTMVAFIAGLELWLTHFEPNYGSERSEQSAPQGPHVGTPQHGG
ncbi:MAG: SPW repeat protein [Bradyrhizobium sp.]|nr:SPW repeat protein [Bradyrhizobium sp.]